MFVILAVDFAHSIGRDWLAERTSFGESNPLTLLAVVALGTPKEDDSDEHGPGLTPRIQPCPATWDREKRKSKIECSKHS